MLREARAIGAVQCGFSGGEPLQRNDLEILVAEAHKLGYYTNLITSGIGLNEQRIEWLKEAGLDHIQLSFQDSTREVNDFLSSTRTFDLKRKAAALIKAHGYPMVMNCVIHRLNIDHIDTHHRARGRARRRLPRARQHAVLFVGAHQSSISCCRRASSSIHAEAVTNRWREKLGAKMKLFFVVPDYYESRPKKCMNGWGNVFMTIAPDGVALPCHTARMLPGLGVSERARAQRQRHLVRIGRLQPLSRHRLDERAVRELSGTREGSRRLPLPGLHAGAGSCRRPIRSATSRRVTRNWSLQSIACRRTATARRQAAGVPRPQGIARCETLVLTCPAKPSMIRMRASSTAESAPLGELPVPVRFDARDLDPAADPRERSRRVRQCAMARSRIRYPPTVRAGTVSRF